MERNSYIHETTWDKLESVLKDDSYINDSGQKPLNSIRKLISNSSRPTRKHHQIRSVSISKESFKTRRPNTPSLSSNTQFPLVPGLTPLQVQSIYAAKCFDLDIPLLPDQEKRFFVFCATHFRDRKFHMPESGLGLNSAKKIGEIIKNNQNFGFLNLSKNSLKDEGCVLLAKSIKKSISLVHLDLSSNEISAEGSEIIISELEHHISLASLDISSHEGLHRNRLGIQGAKGISKILESNRVLAFLNLAGTGLGSDGLDILIEGLRNNKTLVSLNIANNYLGGKSMEKFSDVLLGTDLKELSLASNKIGNEGCEYLSLMIGGGYYGNCTLMKIDLSDNEINTTGLGKIIAALRINTQVKQLDIHKNNFSKGLSQNLLQFLMENVTLESINFSHCNLKCEGLAGVSEGLAKNSGIKFLYFNNNFIEDKGAEILGYAIAKNKALKYLELSSNKIKDQGGLALAKALQINDNIEVLHLKDNNLKDQSGQMFTEVSKFKKNILKLTLDLNQMNYKHVNEVKNNTNHNFQYQQKQLVPKLQKIINKIQFDSDAMDQLTSKLAKKQKEKADTENKLISQGNKLDSIKKIEESKLQELLEEYKTVRERSLKLSEEIESLNMTISVIFM